MIDSCRASNNVPGDPKRKIHSFDYTGVTLLPSRFQKQFEPTLDYFLSIPNDDILRGFRQRAGLAAPGNDLGGWYSGDDKGDWYSRGDTFHTFGQWLSGFSRMAKAANHSGLRDKALYLQAEWAKTIAPDGYFFFSDHPNAPHYTYEKICGGLVDIAEYLGEATSWQHLQRITEWALHNLDRIRVPATYEDFVGGGPLQQSEWYTLSENLYRAYQFTGDPMYREFGQVWHYTTLWNDLARGEDVFPGKHAYSHVNTLCSAAMAYAVTGEPHYLQVITNGYEILRRHHLFATGGFGPSERFVPPDGSLGQSLENWQKSRASAEIPCGSWAGFKLSRYLMTFTGAAMYGDWIERLIYNGIGAALPMAGRGQTFYYASYMLQNARKVYYDAAWPCCSGTFPLAVADYYNLIYFKEIDALYVNLFLPSEVVWPGPYGEVRLVQHTTFPESDSTRLTICLDAPQHFALKLRVPGWLAGPIRLLINNEPAEGLLDPLGWLSLDRAWTNGDQIHVTFPMKLQSEPIDPQHPQRLAFTYGPVVLAADHGPRLAISNRHADAPLVQADVPLKFHTREAKNQVTFRPFYEIGEGVPYWVYMDMDVDGH